MISNWLDLRKSKLDIYKYLIYVLEESNFEIIAKHETWK